MPVIHEFDPPERFVAGTVGEPGARTFFLQARTGARMVSVALEKQQVAALAERVDGLLDDLVSTTEGESLIPAIAPLSSHDEAPLEQPIEEEFRAGTMTLSWDPGAEKIVIEVFATDETELLTEELIPESQTEPEPSELLLVRLTPGAARAFAHRASLVVGAGRPSCPFCGYPMSAEGHLCVRANGYRRSSP
jgi:uncharacterized repeat protein (TIGR03847 family)